MVKFLIRLFKLFSYSVVVLVLLMLALNYASPFYRYPAFKWISSLIEQDYVIKQIGSIELNPKGFSNQISLTNLEIYHNEMGESQNLKIGKLEGRLDFATLWDKGVLFETISLDSISLSLEALVGILLSQGNLSKIELYKNLEIYLPESYRLHSNNRQNENNQTPLTNFNIPLDFNQSLVNRFTNQIEITNLTVLMANKKLEFISANADLGTNKPTFEGIVRFDNEEFNFDISLDNNQSKLFFSINQIPLGLATQLFNPTNLGFLNQGFKSNINGFFDFQKMILQVDDFSITHPIIDINGSLKFEQRNNRNLEINASTNKAIAVNQLMQIWPRAFFDDGLNDWLISALKSGEITKSDFLLRSSLNDLNQIAQKELFELNIETNDLTLRFNPNWQDFFIQSADLKISNLAMQIAGISRDDLGNQINISSEINSFHRNQQLKIKLNSNASGEMISQIIADNPLRENAKLKSLLDLNLTGQTNSEIDLTINLKEQLAINFSGRVELIENKMALNDWLVIENITGEVNFDAENVATQFNASWWNNPIAVEFENSTENQLDIGFNLNFQAISSLDYLFEALEFNNQDLINQIKKSIDGETIFIGKVIATNNPNKADDQLALNNFNFSIALDSSLEGLSLDLIEPLIKSKQEITPLSIALNYTDGKIDFQTLKFDDSINANLVKGVNQSRVDVSFIDLNLDSEKIKFLLGASSTRTLEQKLNQKPLFQMSLPDFDLTVYRLRFDNRDVGSVSSQFRNFSNRIELQNIELISSSIGIKAQLTSSATETNLIASNTKANPFSDYVNYFQFRPITKEAISEINLNLSWPGQIWDYENALLNGTMSVKTGAGTLISDAESSFFPRLIRELSFNSIRNRLENILAFRKIIESINPTTVFEEGIEFDNLDIQLSFRDNQIITDKMNFNSESIDIAIAGYMDWQTKELNHQAIVNPDLFKALPAIGLFSGNIPVAVAALISDRLFDTKDFFRVEYAIEGNLENPQMRLIQSETP